MGTGLPAILILGAGLTIAVSAFIHPFGMVRGQSDDKLFAGTQVDPEVLQIFERSCQNCHSERTEWPWYSYIAPIGWFIEKDVQQGREHMDLSRWHEYDRGSQRDILTRMSAVLKEPPDAPAAIPHPSPQFQTLRRRNCEDREVDAKGAPAAESDAINIGNRLQCGFRT